MSTLRRLPALVLLSFVAAAACKAGTQAPTPQTSIKATQGGQIVYGAVAGATTQAAVLAKLLGQVQAKCGERPQIGRVFQFLGTNSVGVFYTVIDHRQGDKPMAGLAIATTTGPHQAEGALLTDDASRFGKSVNPMLQQLFGVWNPDAAARPGTPPGKSAARVSVPALHKVTLPDSTASASIPMKTTRLNVICHSFTVTASRGVKTLSFTPVCTSAGSDSATMRVRGASRSGQ